jgi:hypothetical protein
MRSRASAAKSVGKDGGKSPAPAKVFHSGGTLCTTAKASAPNCFSNLGSTASRNLLLLAELAAWSISDVTSCFESMICDAMCVINPLDSTISRHKRAERITMNTEILPLCHLKGNKFVSLYCWICCHHKGMAVRFRGFWPLSRQSPCRDSRSRWYLAGHRSNVGTI